VKFVSRHANYKIQVVADTTKAEVLQGGSTRYVPDNRGFDAVFTVRTLSINEIEAAKNQFLQAIGPDAFGSTPVPMAGNMSVADAVDLGYSSTAHEAYDVYQSLSSFDTSDPAQCPPELREFTEQFLSEHYENGFAFCRVDNYALSAPWPTYPVEGPVNVEAVVAFAKAGGFIPAAIVFEQAVGQREDLLVALDQAARDEAVAKDEAAGLTARV